MPRYAPSMLGSVIALLVSGFVTGALARFAVPGPDPMPAWLTIVIGLLGSVIGWGIVIAAVGPDASWVGIASFLVAVALVVLYRRFVQRRALWGADAYRFPERGIGVAEYRERLERAGIDPDRIGTPLQPFAAAANPAPAAGPVPRPTPETDPTDNPAHYLSLLEELHDSGVLADEEYTAARLRLLEKLRG
ncbi:MAG TPA: hypothetical protein VFJ77_00790 [Gaiellaceae bacterium]|nr:hypothetical protein [Gaiellaceae bacterium]